MALDEYKKVLQKVTDSFDAKFGLGRIYYKNEKFIEAQEFLESMGSVRVHYHYRTVHRWCDGDIEL